MKLTYTLALLIPALAMGQAASDVTLTVDLEKSTWYVLDPAETARWASASARTPAPATFVYTFKNHVVLADVTSINGKPAKGTFAAWGIYLNFSAAAAPVPPRPIADINRTQMWNMLIEVHDAEKGQVGTLAAMGLAGGPPPPGTAPGALAGNFAITGGTGAWSGARGQATTMSIAGARGPSAVEDPAYRRVNGVEGIWRIAVTLHSVARPSVTAAFHADFTPVTASSPARAGETLVLAVKGLGATNPLLTPGQTFHPSDMALVVAPVSAAVNDLPASVLNHVGWPGTSDTYRIDVALPSGLAPGIVNLLLTAAWIPGASYPLPVR